MKLAEGTLCGINVADYFDYDSKTGHLTWKRRPLHWFRNSHFCNAWNTKNAGKIAGTKCYRDSTIPMYWGLTIKRKHLSAHSIVWSLHNRDVPSGFEIDHVNGDPFDNRIENLRLATHAQNTQNRGPQRNNTSGLKGIWLNKRNGKWAASINANGKKISLGHHPTKEKAHSAYCQAASIHHGQYAKIA